MKKRDIIDLGKNAMGTVFLIAAAFFMCSTFLSIKTVFADPIAPQTPSVNPVAQSPRESPRTTNGVARTMTSRGGVSRANASRSVSSRGNLSTINSRSRGVSSRNISRSVSPRAVSTSRNVVSRSGNVARVGLTGNAMRATSATTTYSVLSSKLYTGNYSNIIDSTTGLISADAYSTCLESYYTCMDEICTARSDTKGRCSCAGRAVSFLSAEEALEKANEELINLSGQLALLISTKGKDVSAAFQLTDAEKVMNCVSWQDAVAVAGSTKDANGNIISQEDYMKSWCQNHMIYDTAKCSASVAPTYCASSGNDFGFDISSINGSSSDILASLKAWADAKDMAKSYTTDDTGNLIAQYTNISSIVGNLTGIGVADSATASLDSLANTWGYELFEYAHNNVCGRVLDSCFNGIYEACGTPPTVTESNGKSHTKCTNGQSTNCPFNYNSYISVTTSGSGQGDVKLNERGSSNATTASSSSCFGYSTTATTTSDPYSALRGPVADARRSIMNKYLLDANAACDAYGSALQQTAQNIAYQKVAAQQALQQKRLEFYNAEQSQILTDANNAINSFNNCISELWDCYEDMADEENWTTARIKTYCAQISQSPSCYQTMICNPSSVQFRAVIDVADDSSCNFDAYDYTKNTCRNIVTIYDILNGTGTSAGASGSAALREQCLQEALGCGSGSTEGGCIRDWKKAN